jgi:hypothetical protein
MVFGAALKGNATGLSGKKNIGTTHITNGCYHLNPVE